jgi:hypothetical protein
MPRFLYLRYNRGTTRSPWLVDLDAGVGLGQPNYQEDVLLVQFLLEALRTRWRGGAEVRRTAIFDEHITGWAIRAYQRYCLSWYRLLAVDGIVAPLDLRTGILERHIIYWLGYWFAQDFPQYWPCMWNHPAWVGRLGGLGLYI